MWFINTSFLSTIVETTFTNSQGKEGNESLAHGLEKIGVA
jgi:hypothetical protein